MAGTLTFEPSEVAEDPSEKAIHKIVVGALAPTRAFASGRQKHTTTPSALTNSWVIQLVQTENRSLRLTPAPSRPGAAPVSLVVSACDNAVPSDLVRTFAMHVKSGVTLETILHTIIYGRFLSYRFDATGHGSRYWISRFLSFLSEIGVVPSASHILAAQMYLQQVWLPGAMLANEAQQTHFVPGDFFEGS